VHRGVLSAILAVILAVLVLAVMIPRVRQDGAGRTPSTEPAVGSTAITAWQIRDGAAVSDGGARISQPDYPTTGWLAAPPRSTVMAALARSGRYPDVFSSTRLREVDADQFTRPWWYRGTFTTAKEDLYASLHLAGVIPRADVWLNGSQIATSAQIAGAHSAADVDVTGALRPGVNALALRVYPADPKEDLITGWIDWNPWPPDNNMGLWQDITLHRSGPVALSGLRVTTALALPALDSADVTVKVDLRNNGDAATSATVSGTVGDVVLRLPVSVPAKAVRTVTFNPSNTPGLRVARPRVWWPEPLGEHPLYRVALTASVGDAVSDTAATTFGIRAVKSALDGDGNRVFSINGRALLIRAGGWAPDMFLRTDEARLRQQFDLVRDLGLNAIRLEGKLETDEFYSLADEYGIMLLPGWECCNKWEEYGSWSGADQRVAARSMDSVAKRLRNHASVIGFLIGSDEAPPSSVEAAYVDALKRAEWPNPVVSAAAARTSPRLGSSGMKMDGPYDWVPPNYWYGDRLGAADGFASELSAGPSVPELDSLRAMLSAGELDRLWRDPGARQYHAGLGRFDDLARYNNALARRYGTPRSLEQYVRSAQLADYESIRAQFEAYAARMDRPANPSTGVVYWMLNNGWPSLFWHLYDWYLAPGGGTYGARKANRPLHVLWQYGSRAVTVVNHLPSDASGLGVTAEVYGTDGSRLFGRTVSNLSVRSLHTDQALTVPAPGASTGTYLVKLTLTDTAGREVDRNVYWWSTRPDVLAWDNSEWFVTPVSSYADMSALFRMAPTSLSASAATVTNGDTSTVTVTLTNTGHGRVPAFFVEATLRDHDGRTVTPVRWSDNGVTLWPGETLTLTATSDPTGQPLSLEVAGVNVSRTAVPVR